MSVVDQIKNLFSKKTLDSELESRVSLGMPDGAGTETVQEVRDVRPAQSIGSPGEAESPAPVAGDLILIPVLGYKTVAQHQRTLSVMLGAALLALAVVTFLALSQADRVAQQVGATGKSLMQSQRLAKSVTQALVGSAEAFPDVSESAGVLAVMTKGLTEGDSAARITALDDSYKEELDKVKPLVDRTEKNAKAVMAQEKILTKIGASLRLINRQSSDLLEIAETISSLKLQQNAPAAEISAVG
jgi:twitching motility protein PilJ